MEKTVSTSIRMPRALKQRLERKAALLHCARSQVVVSALENFLGEDRRRCSQDEARRQSLMAGKLDAREKGWELVAETDFAGR